MRKRNVDEMLVEAAMEAKEHAEAPPRPEDVIARQAMRGEKPDFLRVTRGNADYGTPVQRDMERLQGRSSSGTVSDRERGARSPLEARRRK